MDFDSSRLRSGEWIVGLAALLLLVVFFVLHWYSRHDLPPLTARQLGLPSQSVNGWQALNVVRWLVLVTVLVSLALVYFQATRRAPAIPATLSVIATGLGLLTLLALVVRVVIDVPGNDGREVGAWLGLAACALLFYGAFRSLRTEGIAPRDGPGDIDTVRLDREPGS